MGLDNWDVALRIVFTLIIGGDIILGILAYFDLQKEVLAKGNNTGGNNTGGEPQTEHVCKKQHTISTAFIVFFSIGGLFNVYQIVLYLLEWRNKEESPREFPVAFTIAAYITASAMSICVILFKTVCKCQGVDIALSGSQVSKEVVRGLFRFVVASVLDLIKCCKATDDLIKTASKAKKDKRITIFHLIFLIFFFICFVAEIVVLFVDC